MYKWIRNEEIITRCLTDGYTCVTDEFEVLTSNAKSLKLFEIINLVQCLHESIGEQVKVKLVSHSSIESLFEMVTVLSNENEEEEKTELWKRLVSLCQVAVNQNASDIHIEVIKNSTRYLLRVDGKRSVLQSFENGESALRQNGDIGRRLGTYMFSLGNVDLKYREIANTSFIVDLEWAGEKKSFEWRASSIPIDGGFKITLRCSTQRDKPLLLKDMGLSEDHLYLLRKMMNQRSGAIFITGPMGSGKSSLIYALLAELDSVERCIHTLEDPVEFSQRGICKTLVEPSNETKKGSGVLKGFEFYAKEQLRHDIDVSVFGELREKNAVKEFCRKAETGGLAIATMHTNSGIGVVSTLIEHMSMAPAVIAGPDLIRLLVHQKLIRKICVSCGVGISEREEGNFKVKKIKNLIPDNWERVRFKSEIGCVDCNYKGEHGRVVVIELIAVNDDDREFIKNQDYLGWKKALLDRGWKDIKQHTIERIAAGEIDIESAEEQVNSLE